MLTHQKENPDQAAVYLLYPAPPPGPLPLRLDNLADFKKHHGPAGVGGDVLLDKVSTRDVLDVLPGPPN